MELSLHAHAPFPPRAALRTRFNIRASCNGTSGTASLFSLCFKVLPRARLSSCVTATADYSRRRPRKGQFSTNKGPGSRGFSSKAPGGTSTQKRERVDNVGKEGPEPGPSGSGENIDSSTSTTTEVEAVDSNAYISEANPFSSQIQMKTKVLEEDIEETEESSSTRSEVEAFDGNEYISEANPLSSQIQMKTTVLEEEIEEDEEDKDEINCENSPAFIRSHKAEQKSTMTGRSKNLAEPELRNVLTNIEGKEKITAAGPDKDGSSTLEEARTLEDGEMAGHLPVAKPTASSREKGTLTKTNKSITELDQQKVFNKMEEEKRPTTLGIDWHDSVEVKKPKILDEEENDKRSTKIKIEKEKLVNKREEMKGPVTEKNRLLDAYTHQKGIEDFMNESVSLGNKLFFYPQVIRPDQEVDIFLNRKFSTLKEEPSVLIMGAFNDWRWKSFTKQLEKTNFDGDWWSCKIFVPKEAYKIDFVFFNGRNVYDNNDSKDFSVPVEGSMDVFSFENFLLEEKLRELERLAAEEAERARKAEEQRQMEAEKEADKADKAQAKMEAEKRRENLGKVMDKAVISVENVWYISPYDFKGGDLIKLYYNRQLGPLAHSGELWIHGGYNNWKDGLSIVERLVRTEKQGGDWWYANVSVPAWALVLDWVFADGPPQNAKMYDNNHHQDFHARVPKSGPEQLYWVEEECQIYERLREERRLRQEAIHAKAKKTAQMKAETKERTMKRFLLSQKHIVYTEPLEIRAGNNVTVFYNPSNTLLSGKPEVWFRCSFNRWTHHKGTLPPQRMMPAENGTHVKVTVKVPLDAYMMDFVFSEKEDGGLYDNKNGMDYHIPVVGGVNREPPMHIVHIAVEMAPVAKVGGLGDVVTSLSRAVQDLGHNVDVILPKYNCLNLSHVRDLHFHKSYHWSGTEIKVWQGKVEGLLVYFLEPQNGLFGVGCIYGKGNDGERFGFFCHAALEFLLQNGSHPDILHCHDWSSAPVAWLFKDHYQHYALANARVVFTVHNLEFGAALIGKAMTYSDKATTVSPNYSKEVSGHPAMAPHLYKFHGIVNGIDPDIWDPFNDRFIPISYTSDNVIEGKKAAKEALQEKLGLRKSDYPLVGIITRLTAQKGIHLIKHAIGRTLDRNGQVVLLGSAPDPRVQNDFVNLANQLHSTDGNRARLCLTYDEPLSHLIYAGADFILVPSIFEPCGLTQLIAMRYGSIPVVRNTGGLYDTVFDVDHDKERAEVMGLETNGFSFDGADPAGVDYAFNRAISAWYDGRDWFNSLCKRVMEQDWSWNRPALDYIELYYAARK